VTSTPARIFKFQEKLGTLAPGSEADVTVSELRKVDFDLFDSTRAKRVGHQKFVPVATVKGGTFVYWEP
jgi:predicted amidohydrolase